MVNRRMLTDSEAAMVFRWVADGVKRPEIADRLGVTQGSLFDRTCESRGRGKLSHPSLAELPRRQGRGGGRPRNGTVIDPTPEQIAEMVAGYRSRKADRCLDFHTENG